LVAKSDAGFGDGLGQLIHDGFVDRMTGAFSLNSTLRGAPNIIVVGRGKTPLYSSVVKTIEGGEHDLGAIDLKGVCRE